MNSAEHSPFTEHAAQIENKPDELFSAFDSQVRGRFEQLVDGKLIVLSWRAAHFEHLDLDSKLVITFSAKATGVQILLIQSNVPDRVVAQVEFGWTNFYWDQLENM